MQNSKLGSICCGIKSIGSQKSKEHEKFVIFMGRKSLLCPSSFGGIAFCFLARGILKQEVRMRRTRLSAVKRLGRVPAKCRCRRHPWTSARICKKKDVKKEISAGSINEQYLTTEPRINIDVTESKWGYFSSFSTWISAWCKSQAQLGGAYKWKWTCQLEVQILVNWMQLTPAKIKDEHTLETG